MENKQIFEIGDRVFDYSMGWGEVIHIAKKSSYPIMVKFNIRQKEYTNDGRYTENIPPTLSFTEYNLVTGGFSQERPEPLPKRGDIVWVRDSNEQSWMISHFVKKQDGAYFVSDDNTDDDAFNFKYLTIKNPYQNS